MKLKLFAVVVGTVVLVAGCGGGGSAAAPSVAPVVVIPTPSAPVIPLAVKNSSYENKVAAFQFTGPIVLPKLNDGHHIGTNYALADFFQDGSYSMVVNTGDFNPASAPQGYTTLPGKIMFFRKINGVWTNATHGKIADATGCITARKLIVADFNGDRKPDVFVSCTGIDAPPFPGEQQRVLFSQPDGSYKNVLLAVKAFAHGASAAVLHTEGYADIVVADQTVTGLPSVLINNKDGTFTQDFSRLPASLQNKLVWTVELIDFGSGKYDAFLSGADQIGSGYEIDPTIFKNDGNNHFGQEQIKIPLVNSTVAGAGPGAVIDISVMNKNIYLLRTFAYKAMSIQKSSVSGGPSTEVYTHTGPYGNGTSWFAWIAPYSGVIVATEADYSVSVQ